MQSKHNQVGFVLVTVLLFMALLTIMVTSIMESSLLESKISNHYGETFVAFYRAERALLQSEASLLQGEIPQNFKLLQSECGVDYYLGVARGTYKDAVINLQSTVAKVDSTAHCEPPAKVTVSGRQSWLML